MKQTGVENEAGDNAALFTPTEIFIELVKAISINQLRAKALVYIKRNRAKLKFMDAWIIRHNSEILYNLFQMDLV